MVNSSQTEIDRFYLHEAMLMADNSPDPSTKMGCIIAFTQPSIEKNLKNYIVGRGYNRPAGGMAVTVAELHDREQKYKLMVHAEEVAVFAAMRNASSFMDTCTLYLFGPIPVCNACAVPIIESGIRRIVHTDLSVIPEYHETYQRWLSKCDHSLDLLARNSVEVVTVQLTQLSELQV